MSYERAFAAVKGVTVVWCEYFGSYQGNLLAKIMVEGETEPRYIKDYYGSCSGCDSFEAEFSYNNKETPEKLAEFGKPYVDAALSLDEVIQQLLPKAGEWYDDEKKEMLDKVLSEYPEKAALLKATPLGTS